MHLTDIAGNAQGGVFTSCAHRRVPGTTPVDDAPASAREKEPLR
ncbi:hypothetical protein AB0H58_24030 [Nocardia neocaledoniensis]